MRHPRELYIRLYRENCETPGLAFSLSAFDRLGRGGNLAVTDRYVFRTLAGGDMKMMVDTLQGERRSLADLEEFQLLAEGMSRLGAYAMLMSDDTFSMGKYRASKMGGPGGRNLTEKELTEISSPSPLRPYSTYATGAGHDQEGPYMALALVHDNGVHAEENVGLLQERIAEGVSAFYKTPWAEDVDESEIMTDGRLLLAKLRRRIAKHPTIWVMNGDNLIAHE